MASPRTFPTDRSGRGRSSPPPLESWPPSHSGDSMLGSIQSRIPRSPSPRRTTEVLSPSEACWTHLGSHQRDGDLNWQRLSPGRQPQFASRHSPSRHSESLEEQSFQPAFEDYHYGINLLERRRHFDRLGSQVDSLSDVDRDGFLYQLDNKNYDHLQNISREPDRDDKPFRKHLYSLAERRQELKYPQYDREYRLLDVNMDHRGLLSGNQNYHRRILSPSPRNSDEEPENSRSQKKKCHEMPSSDYMIPGLTNSVQSSEPQFLHTPEKVPAMPKKSILKKQVDDPSDQELVNWARHDPSDILANISNPNHRWALSRARFDTLPCTVLYGRFS